MKRAVQILLLLSATLLIQPNLVPNAAGANCLIECMGRWTSTSGMTVDHQRELCAIQCRGQTAPPAYGAIAYSRKDKLWGFTYNQNDKATAEKLALQYCAKQGGAHCLIEASFHSICGAIAADGDLVTWGTDGSRLGAQQRAEYQCSRLGGKKCESQASICSSPDVSGGSDLAITPLPPRAVSWGAVAYSSSDMAAGWSQGKDDRASAEKEALATCAQRGKACTVRTAFNKQCGALAADRQIAGWGISADQREAQQKAIDECKKAGGARCVVHVSFCSL
jgi:hypothetical protein